MAANIGECMEEHGVNFIGECVPIRRQKVEDGSLGKLKVQSKYNHSTEFVDEFNKIWLEGVGVAVNPKNGKLLYNELERSGVDNIYAIGEVLVTTGCVYVYGTGGQLRAAVTGY